MIPFCRRLREQDSGAAAARAEAAGARPAAESGQGGYLLSVICIIYLIYVFIYISTYLGAAGGGGQAAEAGGGLCLHERNHAEGDGAAGPESPGGG